MHEHQTDPRDPKRASPDPPVTYDRVYCWGKYRPELKGKRCRLLARGAINSALVEFQDGERHVVSRNAIKKVKAQLQSGH